MTASVITQVIKRDKGICHYCKEFTDRRPRSPRQATKEHVLPRSMGGPDSIDNFVLACAECNNKRGTALFYCRCETCAGIIDSALNNSQVLNFVFEAIIKNSKPVVKKVYETGQNRGVYLARLGCAHRYFDTFEQAIDYAINGTFKKGE